eukprot:m.110541 g.110541  ORF g.110541 m.110541 type:complete len:1300 (-) comp15369_c0_seq3:3375-7274(-)
MKVVLVALQAWLAVSMSNALVDVDYDALSSLLFESPDAVFCQDGSGVTGVTYTGNSPKRMQQSFHVRSPAGHTHSLDHTSTLKAGVLLIAPDSDLQLSLGPQGVRLFCQPKTATCASLLHNLSLHGVRYISEQSLAGVSTSTSAVFEVSGLEASDDQFVLVASLNATHSTPTSKYQLFHHVSAHFNTSSFHEVAELAQARQRRSVWPYTYTREFQIVSWNRQHGDLAVEELTIRQWRYAKLSCLSCYMSLTAPVEVDILWGLPDESGWDSDSTLEIKATAGLKLEAAAMLQLELGDTQSDPTTPALGTSATAATTANPTTMAKTWPATTAATTANPTTTDRTVRMTTTNPFPTSQATSKPWTTAEPATSTSESTTHGPTQPPEDGPNIWRQSGSHSVFQYSTQPIFLFSIGPVPISADLGLDVAINYEGHASGKLTAQVGLELTASAGRQAHFFHNGATGEYGASFNPAPASLQHRVIGPYLDYRAALHLEAALAPKLSLTIDGIAVVAAEVDPTVSFDAAVGDSAPLNCRSLGEVHVKAMFAPTMSLEAQATVGISSLPTWDSPVYSFGPYELLDPIILFEQCAGLRRRRTLSSSCSDSQQQVSLEQLKIGYQFDTCTNITTTFSPTCRMEGDAREFTRLAVNLLPGVYHLAVSSPGSEDYALAVTALPACFSTRMCFATTPTNATVTQTLIVTRNTTYLLSLANTKASGCGKATLTVTPDTVQHIYVDCAAGNDDSGSGSLEAPLQTLQAALDTAATRWSPQETEADIILLPDSNYSCYYSPPSQGYVLPSTLRQLNLTIRSLHGATVQATSLYNAHLHRCDETNAQTDEDCFTDNQFSAMSYGSAYDTQLHGAGLDIPAFNLDGDRVNFIGIGFVNFASSSGGAVVNATKSSLSILNCLFEDVSSTGIGGVLALHSSNVTVAGSIALGSRGHSGGFASLVDRTQLAMYNSLVLHSDAAVGSGGVFLVQDSSVHLASSTFTGNSAEMAGGILATNSSRYTDQSTITIDGVNFISNDAGRVGGAISLTDNARLTSTGVNQIQRNVAGLYGGAVAIRGQGARWTDSLSQLRSNSAPAVHVQLDGHVQLQSTQIQDSSRVGVSGSASDTLASPGALVCLSGSLDLHNGTLAAFNSFDAFGNPTANVACVDCSGCDACAGCGPCGRCTTSGCDIDFVTRDCQERWGPRSSCNATTGRCQTAPIPDQPTSTETPSAASSSVASTVSSIPPSTSTIPVKYLEDDRVEAFYKPLALVLGVLLGVSLLLLLMVVRRSCGTPSIKHKVLPSIQLHDSEVLTQDTLA